MRCPTCQITWTEGASYCQNCGRAREASNRGSPYWTDPAELSNLCVICFHVNAPISRYCTSCGASLPSNEIRPGMAENASRPRRPRAPSLPTFRADGVTQDGVDVTADLTSDLAVGPDQEFDPDDVFFDALEPTSPGFFPDEPEQANPLDSKPANQSSLDWNAQSTPAHELPRERRTVTVLHVDVCGFTRIAEQLTPEQTRLFINDLFELMAREINANGGRVDAYIGDAVLAVFGFPLSHLDDPIRAANAAVSIHRVLARYSHPLLSDSDKKISVRIGIDTGPVIVGRIGAIQRTTVTGATVAAAMELEKAATPGSTLVGEVTRSTLPSGFKVTESTTPSGRVAFELVDMSLTAFSKQLEAEGPNSIRVEAGPLGSTRSEAGVSDSILPEEGRLDLADNSDNSGRFVSPDGHAIGPGGVKVGPNGYAQEAILTPEAYSGQNSRLRAQEQTRIDRLPLEQRRILKLAAVVGVFFWQEALERLGATDIDGCLAALRDRGLIKALEFPSIPGTSEYRFRSSLLREVAYQNSLIKVRIFLHRVVASWLGEKVATDPSLTLLLVHHHLMGGDRLSASRILIDAAARSAKLHAYAEARQYYSKALEYLSQESDLSLDAARLLRSARDGMSALPQSSSEAR